MKGLTKLEVDLLIDAAAPEGSEPRVLSSPQMAEACLDLRSRRLISFVVDSSHVVHGVATPLGRLVLSIALAEPSLVRP